MYHSPLRHEHRAPYCSVVSARHCAVWPACRSAIVAVAHLNCAHGLLPYDALLPSPPPPPPLPRLPPPPLLLPLSPTFPLVSILSVLSILFILSILSIHSQPTPPLTHSILDVCCLDPVVLPAEILHGLPRTHIASLQSPHHTDLACSAISRIYRLPIRRPRAAHHLLLNDGTTLLGHAVPTYLLGCAARRSVGHSLRYWR